MPIIDSLLPEEDLAAFRRARGLEEPAVLPKTMQKEAPVWQDQFEVLKYSKYTQEPETLADKLALSIFAKDQSSASARRFSDDLDQHYIKPDGTFDQELWQQDNFVLDIERAFYENRGKIPLEWLMQFAEDLEFMGGEYAPQIEKLHRLSMLETQRRAAKEKEIALFNQDVDFIAEWQEVGRQEALLVWASMDNLANSFGDDIERGQQALDEIQPGLNYAEMLEMHRQAQDGRPSYTSLSDRRADLAAADEVVYRLIGEPVGWLVGGLGAALDFAGDHLPKPSWASNPPISDETRQTRKDAIKALEAQIGLSDDEFIAQMGFGEASELWRALPGIDPDVHRTFLAMAAGDEGLAQSMFADEVLYQEENREHAKRQKEIYDAQNQYQITELENRNFGTSDTIMDAISAYGEAMEYVATGATLAAVDMLNGELPTLDAQFFQDIRDHDSPASVLGLDGTLTGLIFDFGATAAVDPTVWVFGPRLSASGRAGAANVDDALRMVDSPAAFRLRTEIIDVGRSASHNATAYASALDNLFVNGFAEQYMAATKGFRNPVTGKRNYLYKDIAGSVDDVSYHLLERFHPDDITSKTLVKAADRIQKNGLDAVEITYNPATKKAAITGGSDIGPALQYLGHDAVPVSIKIDPDAGLTVSRNVDDWSKALGVVDGRVPVEKIKNLLRYDFRGSADNAALVADVAENGVEKAIAIAIDPDTGAVTVINGNHRLSAALDAGVVDVPVRVSFKRKLADTPGLPDRAKPKAPQVWDDAPMVGDPAWVDVPEWGTINPETHGVKVGDDALHGRPRDIIGEKIFDEPALDVLREIELEHIKSGGNAISGMRTVTGISAATYVGDLMRNSSSKFLERIGEFANPINSNTHFVFNGPAAFSELNQFGNRLWASVRDTSGFEPYLARILEFYRNRGVLKLEGFELSARARQLVEARKGAQELIGHSFHDDAARMGANPSEAYYTKKAETTRQISKYNDELKQIAARQREIQGGMTETKSLIAVLDEMVDDFNRKHIATNKQWKGLVDEETGMVPWEKISEGTYGDGLRQMQLTLERARKQGKTVQQILDGESGYLPAEVRQALKKRLEGGENLEGFITDALNFLNAHASWNSPVSPLELMAASNGGPSLMKRVQHRLISDRVMQGARTAQMLWALDKVLTPRTAIVVSVDELVRASHLGGSRATLQLMEDKALQISRRFAGAQNLPKRWRDRLVALEQYPTFYRQLERSFLEIQGVGPDEIKLKKGGRNRNIEYFEAAQRTTGQMLNDAGFQKYLEGEAAFREWFETDTRAARLRNMEFFDPTDGATKTGMTADMALQYYRMFFEEYALGNIKKGKRGEARKLWQDAAERQLARGDTAGGPITLPDWVLEGYGSVTGNVNVATTGQRMFNSVAQRLFQSPVNYRRGFMAEWIRKSERARLAKLYKSQGKRIVPDDEILMMIKREHPHWTDQQLNAHLPTMQKELFEMQGIVSESYVSKLVEHTVVGEMENALYSFQLNSQGSRGARAIAPFGKPYADMMGFWGRELMSRPQLRGWLNNENFMNLGKIANKAADNLPFNPKTAGFISRVAALDLDLDNIQDDPLIGRAARAVGLESADLGASIFLPNSTSNPFGVLFPGLGVLPVGAAQWVFNHTAPDPVEDPLAYQQHVDTWSQIFPGIGYNQGNTLIQGIVQLAAGGGTVARFEQGVEAIGGIAGSTHPGANAINGSWGGRVEANRRVKLVFQDTNIWEEFNDLPLELTGEGLALWLDEKLQKVVAEGQTAQSLAELKELATEIQIPIRADYGAANDQLNEVWIDSIEWMGAETPPYIDMSSETGKRQAADWARTKFFALPDWKRDALVTQHPGLAVNLVSMWEWTDKAKNTKRLIGQTGTPYRSGGSTEDLARHESYQQLGYIQPVTPSDLTKRIIGTIINAKRQTSRDLYTEVVGQVNDQRWEHVVTPEWKEWLDATATWLSDKGILPYRTGRELWANYTDLKNVYDIEFYPPGEDDEGNKKKGFTIPRKMLAWSEQYPSGPDALREELEEGYPIPLVTDKMQELADALGVNLSSDDGTPTEVHEVYRAVADFAADEYLENPIFIHVADDYLAWSGQRSAGAQAVAQAMGTILDSSAFTTETRWEYKKNIIFLDEVMRRRSENDPSWLRLRDEAVDRYVKMFQDDAFRGLNAWELWDQGYSKSLGALDWEPLEPAPLFQDGSFNPNASTVYVSQVLDGDTVDVTFGDGILPGREFNRVRLLGYNAAELGQGGESERDALEEAIRTAVQNGTPISIVRDPRFGDTDMYGRIFAWLYIGEDPWYNPDSMIPRRD